MHAIENSIYTVLHAMNLCIAVAGALIILLGCIRGMQLFVCRLAGKDMLLADIRIEIGHYLVLGLEFFIAKDMIDIVLRPTWNELGKLAVIIVLRSLLTLFLSHEVKEVREEIEQEGIIRRLKMQAGGKKR